MEKPNRRPSSPSRIFVVPPIITLAAPPPPPAPDPLERITAPRGCRPHIPALRALMAYHNSGEKYVTAEDVQDWLAHQDTDTTVEAQTRSLLGLRVAGFVTVPSKAELSHARIAASDRMYFRATQTLLTLLERTRYAPALTHSRGGMSSTRAFAVNTSAAR